MQVEEMNALVNLLTVFGVILFFIITFVFLVWFVNAGEPREVDDAD